MVGSRAKPVSDNRVHEETTIACQDCSIFGGHDLEEVMILPLWFVRAIQSEEAEVAGETAEVSIDDEPFAPAPLQAGS